jgi:pyruvate ferredoxin oxidoreductase alpha subunit
MHEVLFTAAGMRLPLVMFVGNRAVSAPLNIWNDQQDSISQRDCGWIQLYCESIQETVDSIPQAYKIAESTSLPVMVCGDGHYLTHAVEQVDIPAVKEIDDFLPAFNPKVKLDPQNPVSLGVYANPSYYQEFRQDLDNDLRLSAGVIKKAASEWNEKFGRDCGLIDEFQTKDADRILVTMGSITPTMRLVAMELRTKGEEVGVLRVRSFRPFPAKEILDVLEDKTIGVFEKDLSLGGSAPLYAEVSDALRDTHAIISSFVGGLGGRDITTDHIRYMFEKIKGGNEVKEFVGVKK